MKLKDKKLTLVQRDAVAGLVFVLPFIIGLVIVFLPSLIKSIAFSFNNIVYETGGYSLEWRGLDYYKTALLEHTTYNKKLVETIISMVVNVPLVLVFSFFMSTLLNSDFKGRTFMQVVVFLPVITASGVLAVLNAADVSGGIITSATSGDNVEMQMGSTLVLDMLGLSGALAQYFTTAISKLYEVITTSGIQILIFLAGLRTIPESVYEAATMEGATGWESFWKVTFPMVSPYILINVVYSIVNSLSSSTSPVLGLILETARTGSVDLSLSAAMAFIFCGLELIILMAMVFIVSRIVFYYD